MENRLRAVPLFSYSPSRAERKKQAARKLAARKLVFVRPVFFAPLSTDYKKTKGLLVVYMENLLIGTYRRTTVCNLSNTGFKCITIIIRDVDKFFNRWELPVNRWVYPLLQIFKPIQGFSASKIKLKGRDFPE